MAKPRETSICLPESLYAEIEKAATAQHRSVEEVTVEAVERYIKDAQWTSLKAYGREKANELGIHPEDIERLIAESRLENRR